MKSSLGVKTIYETHIKSIILDKLFLYHMGKKIDISQNRRSEVRVLKVTGQVSMDKQIEQSET